MKIISKRGTNIREGVKNIKIYIQYEPQKLSVFVTQFRGTRQPWLMQVSALCTVIPQN